MAKIFNRMSNAKKKKIYNCKITSNVMISDKIMKIVIHAPEVSSEAMPGQFVNVYPEGGINLLPRPISICDVDEGKKTITLIYAIVGEGTSQLASKRKADTVRVSSPLGNGFTMPWNMRKQDMIDSDDVRVAGGAESGSDAGNLSKKAILVGGGVGIAPLIFLSRILAAGGIECTFIAGFRDDIFLEKEINEYASEVFLTTEEPRENAFMGNVAECLEVNKIKGDIYYACGPYAMLKNVNRYVETVDGRVQVSLEERMGCGYGACVGCACDMYETALSGTKKIVKKKVCFDGPVFFGDEVVWK